MRAAFENQDVAVTVRRGISIRSHEKIGDCEQSRKQKNLTLSSLKQQQQKKPIKTTNNAKTDEMFSYHTHTQDS